MAANQVDRLKALHEIGQALTSEYDLDLLLSMIVDAAARMLDSEEITLYLADETMQVLFARSQKTSSSDLPRLLLLKTSDNVIVEVFRTGKATLHVAEEASIAAGIPCAAMLAVPLGFRGERLGVLAAYNWSKGQSFSREDERFLSCVSSYAAIALRNSRVMRKKEILATTDELTQVLNRGAFNDAIHREVEYSRRYGTPLGLLLIDLDFFKEFNDRHGHQAGDARLIRVADLLRNQTRASDKAFRIGGDEFAVIAPFVDEAAVSTMAERIRSAALAVTAQLSLEGISSTKCTVSIGTSVLVDGNDSPELLFLRADQALIEAKKRGGDQVIFSDTVSGPEATNRMKEPQLAAR